MTWESQGHEAPQDPRSGGTQPPPYGQAPPPGQPPSPGYVPPAPGYPSPHGGYAPPGYGQPPPPGYGQPPPPGYGQPQGGWAPPPPPPASMWQPPPAYPLAPDAYPVNVSFDRLARINRFWGIPILGTFIRIILLIPHYIMLALVSIVVAVLLLFTWIPVLLLGRFPGWGYRWIGGWLSWSVRVGAYAGLLTPTYPPFSRSGEDHPISIRFDEGVRINRLWGIPFLGIAVRAILLIPHFFVLWLLGIVVGILSIFAWVPVLIFGRQADLVYTVIGGFTRWSFRVTAYLLLMVDRYPPFSLGEDDPRL